MSIGRGPLAVLEIPYGTLSESGDLSSAGYSRGLSTEAFEALPRVRFEAPRHGATLHALHPARRTPPPPRSGGGSAASGIGHPRASLLTRRTRSVCRCGGARRLASGRSQAADGGARRARRRLHREGPPGGGAARAVREAEAGRVAVAADHHAACAVRHLHVQLQGGRPAAATRLL